MPLHLGVILALFVNNSIFFFSKLIKFVAILGNYKTILANLSKDSYNPLPPPTPQYKLYLFSILSKAHIVDVEYLQ